METVVSVSVDLDEVASYHAIHGLRGSEEAASRAVWTTAVPRFSDFFDKLAIKATFFVVGSSLDSEIGAPRARDLAAAGHELANHTYSHFYDLLRRGPSQRRDEVVRGADAIEGAVGTRPKGFRAPGYNVDDQLFDLLAELGFLYDSSVFPCPPYYLAKAAALATMRVRGRSSSSVLGPKEVLLAPAEPYSVEPGSAFWRGRRSLFGKPKPGRGIVELPIAVVPGVRSPYIGTALALAGLTAARAMSLAMLARRFVGLELHGIDALDIDDEGLGDLAPHQPDLGIPFERKLEIFETAITTLASRGARFETCFEAARAFRGRA